MDIGPLDRIKHRHADLHRSLLSYPMDLSSLPLPTPTPAWLTVLSVHWGQLGLMPLSLQALGCCFPSLRWCFRMHQCQLIKHRMRPSQRLSQGQSLCQPPLQTLHRCSQWNTPLKIVRLQSPCTSPDASGNWTSPVDTELQLDSNPQGSGPPWACKDGFHKTPGRFGEYLQHAQLASSSPILSTPSLSKSEPANVAKFRQDNTEITHHLLVQRYNMS